MRVYISYRDLDTAIVVAEQLIVSGHKPYLPRLHKYLEGLDNKQWLSYYADWLTACDCLWKGNGARDHELAFAASLGMPIVTSITMVEDLKLPRYAGVCKDFGIVLAKRIEDNEDRAITSSTEQWRRDNPALSIKALTDKCGITYQPLELALDVGERAFKVWDVLRR